LPSTFPAQVGVDVRRADEDAAGTLLRAARAEHLANADPLSLLRPDLCVDDLLPGQACTLSDLGGMHSDRRLARFGARLLVRASWRDGGTACGALRRWRQRERRPVVRISASTHGELSQASPYQPSGAPPSPDADSQARETVAFLDAHLRGVGTAPTGMRYVTMGPESWHDATDWPPPDTEMEAWWFAPGGLLSRQPPTDGGADPYEVDWSASTGTANRWHTQIGGGPVVYPDLIRDGWRRLTYTSAPLSVPVEILGTPLLDLYVACDRPDAAVFAYLLHIGLDGVGRTLTDGQLRFSHRRGTFRRADMETMRRGVVEKVSIALLPLAVRIPAGGQLAISLAGCDSGSFERVPATGPVHLAIARGGNSPSRALLPTGRL
ncbi:MAG: CocE/NonD family hydrolase, partial [Mycobacteriales bacterium]